MAFFKYYKMRIINCIKKISTKVVQCIIHIQVYQGCIRGQECRVGNFSLLLGSNMDPESTVSQEYRDSRNLPLSTEYSRINIIYLSLYISNINAWLGFSNREVVLANSTCYRGHFNKSQKIKYETNVMHQILYV